MIQTNETNKTKQKNKKNKTIKLEWIRWRNLEWPERSRRCGKCSRARHRNQVVMKTSISCADWCNHDAAGWWTTTAKAASAATLMKLQSEHGMFHSIRSPGSNTLSSLPQNRKNGFHYHRPPFCLQPVRFISIPYSRRIILIGSVFLSFKYIFTIKCDYRIQRHNRINLLHDIIFDANLPARVSAALIPWFDGFDNGFPLILQLLLLHCIVTRSPLRFP